jgi:hypothetical protein
MGPALMNQQGYAADDTAKTTNRPGLGHDELCELMASGEPLRSGGIEWLLDWIETRPEDRR